MATVALWHLGVTGILAGALSMVILVQSLGDGLRRLRRPAAVPAQVRPLAEPRTLRPAARTAREQAPAMASAAGAS